jgi:teichuronic acid biosynthesis glycosyltransferase TuaC
MRILGVSPNLATRALPMRGASRDEQMQLFADAGHEVRAIVPLPWSPRRWIAGVRVPAEEREGAVVVHHPNYPRLPSFLRGRSLERRLFTRAVTSAIGSWAWTPDVVLAHSASLPGGLVGRFPDVPFVVALYDHEVYERPPQATAARDAIAQTLRSADCAVYVSETLRRNGVELAGPHRTAVITFGIETFPDLSRMPPERFTVCTVTRLVARKRVDHVIRAFARLAAEHPDARLVIVGDGPERSALTRLVHVLGITGRVEFTGALDARRAREYMARASVMALPSVREALGAVYLEAMSLGVPSLGTRGEAIEEHIEHGVSGVLVPPGDESALFAELRALAVDPERSRRIGEAGRKRFWAGPFSWRANALSYLALFEELSKTRGTLANRAANRAGKSA